MGLTGLLLCTQRGASHSAAQAHTRQRLRPGHVAEQPRGGAKVAEGVLRVDAHFDGVPVRPRRKALQVRRLRVAGVQPGPEGSRPPDKCTYCWAAGDGCALVNALLADPEAQLQMRPVASPGGQISNRAQVLNLQAQRIMQGPAAAQKACAAGGCPRPEMHAQAHI